MPVAWSICLRARLGAQSRVSLGIDVCSCGGLAGRIEAFDRGSEEVCVRFVGGFRCLGVEGGGEVRRWRGEIRERRKRTLEGSVLGA